MPYPYEANLNTAKMLLEGGRYPVMRPYTFTKLGPKEARNRNFSLEK